MYHAANGLYFEHLETGDVHIIKRADSDPESKIIFEQIIDEGTWASIVSTVSAYGENYLSFQEALMFHRGKRI